jgi:hypothetical protein
MQKTVLAALLGASVLAVPAFAQLNPAGAPVAPGAPGQATVPATGTGTTTGTTSTTTDASGASTLGLGGLLKQAQAQEPAGASDAGDGAGPTGNLIGAKVKARTRANARTQGH